MPSGRDPIAMVEACYDLHASESDWLANVARCALPLMKVDEVLAYHVDVSPRGLHIRQPVSTDPAGEALARIRGMADMLERVHAGSATTLDKLQGRVYEKVIRMGIVQPADRMLLSEIETYGPRWMYTLGVPRVRELLHLISGHIDGHGATLLIGPRLKSDPLRRAERATYQMLSAHLKAGLRLRRRLAACQRDVETPPGGAVLDASTRVVHAEGEARDADARAQLAARARDIDRARTHASGRNEEALAVWRGLVDGRWSLVERFDADGKRYLLAHRNPEHVVDPRGLSDLEARVTGLAARGYSDKIIGYHLGVTEGTVASCLSRSMRKLGFSGRTDLVRTLGVELCSQPTTAVEQESS